MIDLFYTSKEIDLLKYLGESIDEKEMPILIKQLDAMVEDDNLSYAYGKRVFSVWFITGRTVLKVWDVREGEREKHPKKITEDVYKILKKKKDGQRKQQEKSSSTSRKTGDKGKA